MVEALTQRAWHAKSQSAATFCSGAMRVFATTTPSSILFPHPFPLGKKDVDMLTKTLAWLVRTRDGKQLESGWDLIGIQ